MCAYLVVTRVLPSCFRITTFSSAPRQIAVSKVFLVDVAENMICGYRALLNAAELIISLYTRPVHTLWYACIRLCMYPYQVSNSLTILFSPGEERPSAVASCQWAVVPLQFSPQCFVFICYWRKTYWVCPLF
jgi:hypothetical protein